MSPGRFRVTRAVVYHGIRREPGEVIEVSDAVDLAVLIEGGKVEPADGKTSRRLRSDSIARWTNGEPTRPPEARDPWTRVY